MTTTGQTLLFRLTGVARDLDAVCKITAGLHADYVAARMTWHTAETRVLHVSEDKPER